MASVKILHCADLHIGAVEGFLGAKAQSRRIETLMTFENIMALANKSGVDIVLIAGDLIDSNNIEHTFIERIFTAISAVPNTKVIFAAGNHDPLSANSPFISDDMPKNLFVLPTYDSYFEFSELKTRVYGKSFGSMYTKGVPSFSLKTDDEFINLMCIHGETCADLNSDYNSITEQFIRTSGMDYIALGHIHKRTEIGKIGSVYCAYCGCPEGQGFDELGSKGVYLGDVSKSACDLKFIPFSKRMHLLEKVDIGEYKTSTEITDNILKVISEKYGENAFNNLYKIVLCGNIDDDTVISLAEITTRLNEILYFAKVKNGTELLVDFETLRQEKTLKGIFVDNMLKKIEDAENEEKDLLNKALLLGLKAFKAEVSFDED